MNKKARVTIWHNPNCSTSRKVLEMLQKKDLKPVIVQYLRFPPGRDALADVAAALGGARKLLRERGTPAEELGLTKPGVADQVILDAMAKDPILIERPVVITSKGIRLGRPPETVLEIL